MAQAARLNLRMQKELKLLLSDPPPGASFPHLSRDSDLSSFSLSSIYAQIQGPEGTVYEKGTFKINIQIPDRYPFQPPVVTFDTPIYHPNIDNGGRICLDILNLPPKGAWQPSLNISTVLTSIGLLLSEPNPDDGLMCEASKEYKYNRQAFDQKARSLTEKFALCSGSENDKCSPNLLNHRKTSMVETKELDLEPSVDKCFVGSKKLLGISGKLALESSGSNLRDSDIGVEVNQLGVEGPKEDTKVMANECSQGHEKLLGKRRRLALESIAQIQTRNHDEKENVGPHCTSIIDPQSISLGSSESLLVLQSGQHSKRKSEQTNNEDLEFKPKTSISEKLCISQTRPLETSYPGKRSSDCQDNLIAVSQILSSEPFSKVAEGKSLESNAINCDEIESQNNSVGFSNLKCKKLGLADKKSSSGLLSFPRNEDKKNKENLAPIRRTILSHANTPFTKSSMSSKTWQTGPHYEEKSGNNDAITTAKKLPLLPLDQFEGMNGSRMKLQQDRGERFAGEIKQSRDELPNPEAVIVLDSEDSEDERENCSRSKLSIVRKRLPGKWKAKR